MTRVTRCLREMGQLWTRPSEDRKRIFESNELCLEIYWSIIDSKFYVDVWMDTKPSRVVSSFSLLSLLFCIEYWSVDRKYRRTSRLFEMNPFCTFFSLR
jgi:hypothetical protein